MYRLGTRMFAPLGAVAVVVVLLFGAGTAAACSTSPPTGPTTLTTIPLIDAIAANSTMVFAQGVTNCSQIWAVTAWGSVYVYATVPVANASCTEGALALAPATNCSSSTGPVPDVAAAAAPTSDRGRGGGGNGHSDCHQHATGVVLYDVVGGNLFEISNNGANVTLLATFPVSGKSSENMGLAYDQVGTFNHELIVTSSFGGYVWLYNCTGNVTLLAKLHTYIGGPAVAPMSFGTYGGDIVLAAKTRGEVLAITPSGNVSAVANWSKANAVTFPSTGGDSRGGWGNNGCGGICTFGFQHYALFVANYTSGALEAFTLSQLRGYSGQGFVAGGLNQGIAAFAANGKTTLFASQTLRLSDIASVTCFPPTHGGGHHGWGW